jgi:phosphomannomutase
LTSFKRLYELSYNLPLESLKETNLNVFQEKLKSLLAEKYYLIRCSGTENVLRIFIQLESLTLKEEIEKMIKELQ